jgi:PAS domain S-box-containing protein
VNDSGEILRLRGCINNLVSLQALPALWAGHEASRILPILLEALVGMLNLDFAYARTVDTLDGKIEMVRVRQGRPPDVDAGKVGQALEPWVKGHEPLRPMTSQNPIGDGRLSIAPLRFGMQADTGVLVVGSDRADFPTTIEMLLLRAAANHATIALHESSVAAKQRQAAQALERRVVERTAQLTRSNEELRSRDIELRALHEKLAAELEAMTRLHELSGWLVVNAELQPFLEHVLDAMAALQQADFGIVHLYDAASDALEIVAQRGFGREVLEHFARVDADPSSAWGRALARRQRVVIADVETDAVFAPHRQIAASTGYRAVQSTPLINRAGKLLGIISTHFRRPHSPSAHDLRLTDLYAGQAAEMIDFNFTTAERRKLAALVENSSDFIGIASLEGVPRFLNAAGRRIVGLAPSEDLSATTMLDYIHDLERTRFEQQILPSVVRHGGWEGEMQFRHFKTGAPIPMLQHIFYIKEGERRLGMATISRDMTERKRAEEAVTRAQEDLAHATRVMSMGELTASIAHEVNQPLAGVMTNADACRRWLMREVPNLVEARDAAERIIRDGRRAGDVISRIRALSRKTTPQRARLQLNDVIHEVLTLAHSKLLSQRISLTIDLSARLPEVLGDRVQLQQVLLNLIINAVEAIHPVVDRARELQILSHAPNTGGVQLTVRDSGVGLDSQAQTRLFDPFFTTKPEGMGLGLSISRRIVEEHGGQLRATANSDHGTTLVVVLPAATDRTG